MSAVTGELVCLSDGTQIPSRTVVWTAGSAPNPILADLPCVAEHGRIVADECLRVPGWPGVWALGDCALVPDRRNGGFHPQGRAV